MNSSLQCSAEHTATINKTPHEVRLPAQTKLSFIPNKCRLALQHTDETTPHATHHISENSSANDWSRGLLLRQNRLSFPTRAVLPDNGRRDDTLPPTHFRKLLSKWQFRAIFIFSCFHYFLRGRHVPPPSPPRTRGRQCR